MDTYPTPPNRSRAASTAHPRRRGTAMRLLIAGLAAMFTLAIAGTASAATATWDGYTISTQAPIVAGGGVKAFAQSIYGPNPLKANRAVEYRVVRNIGGTLTYSTVTRLDASSPPFPTSAPGIGANAFPIGFPCNTGTTTTYVPQVRVVNTLNDGGSGWVSGAGVNLNCRT